MKTERSRNSDMLLHTVYFWTITIVSWKHLLKKDKYKQIIIDSLQNLVERKLIVVYGFVIMPNHIHILWEILAMNNKEFANRSFAKFTAHSFKKDLQTHHPHILEIFKCDKNDREYQFWQQDPLAIEILNKEMFLQKLDYIHLNPLQEHWQLADKPENYKWSSANYYECNKNDFSFITHFADRF